MSKRIWSALSLTSLGILAVVAAGCAAAGTPVPPAAATAVLPSAPTSVPPTSAPEGSIQDILWQWTSVTNKPTGETTAVASPQDYTITFRDDGTLSGRADCNNFAGTYSEEGGLTITLGATTEAFCGEASMDQQYLELLGAVVAGGPDGAGGLALENAGGEQRMEFVDGGFAPAE